jgi:hypothetical protein
MEDRKEYQLGGGIDLEFANYLKERLKVFEDLDVTITYNDYFKRFYLSGTLPADHNPDYILGLVDGIVHEHKRME